MRCDTDGEFTGALGDRVVIDDDAGEVRLFNGHGRHCRHVATYAFERQPVRPGAAQALRYRLQLVWAQIVSSDPSPNHEPEHEQPEPAPAPKPRPRHRFDLDELRRALQECGGSINAAAKQLGVPYTTLRYQVRRNGLQTTPSGSGAPNR